MNFGPQILTQYDSTTTTAIDLQRRLAWAGAVDGVSDWVTWIAALAVFYDGDFSVGIRDARRR